MERNRVAPYFGEEPYIFVSYSHKNEAAAMEIIRSLHDAGFRVWYDEGIAPASVWDDNIANHVEQCGLFLALLSQEYIDSSNCKDELNYAREMEKSRLLVYLQDIQLIGGMRMRLSRLQAIHRYKYDNQQLFYEKLFSAQGIEICRGATVPHTLTEPQRKDNAGVAKVATAKVPICKFDSPNAALRLIFVIDTSASMSGQKISAVNKGIQKTASSLAEKYREKLAIDILQCDTSPKWRTLADLPLRASGSSQTRDTLTALAQYGSNVPKQCGCAIVFVSNHDSRDSYTEAFTLLKQQTWFRQAVKTAICLSQNGNIPKLGHILTSPYAVTLVEDHRLLSAQLKAISIASVMAAEQNTQNRTRIFGRDIIHWLDRENIDEALQWEMHGGGTLIITAGGIIPDFHPPKCQPPWISHRDSIKRVIIKGHIRNIGRHAFSDLPNLEKVFLPASVTNIGQFAFASCPKLVNVIFSNKPYTVRKESQKNFLPINSAAVCQNAFKDSPWSLNQQNNHAAENR